LGRLASQREIAKTAYNGKFTGIGVGQIDLKAGFALDMHDQIEKAEGIENSGSQEFRVARDFNVIRSTFVGFDPIDNELLQLFLAHQSYSYRAGLFLSGLFLLGLFAAKRIKTKRQL
jgi:hypothetical protein